ncbi:hypothetical protein N9I56_07260 [Alphaproteobacteria bacterium]|mgnify:FL=1|jgi:hypothetical protein|nr:hypothetical protein [Alphaproteobacteria bacterium]MDA9023263.1 hypothetical protein [Alphaproteobacteria bacterium]
MSGKENKLDGQINVFLALRGHDHQMVDWWQVMREMMEEINHWRMVAKHPNAVERLRGGQKTAAMDRIRYQHMIGYLTGKHEINQQEAAEIISEHSMSLSGGWPKPKTILELASGWKTKHEFSKPSNLFDIPRWQRHEETLYELMEMSGDPDYFPEQIANYRKPE